MQAVISRKQRRRHRHKSRQSASSGRLGRRALVASGLVLLLAVVFVAVQLLRPVPAPSVRTVLQGETTVPGNATPLPFAPGAETAVLVSGVGTIGSVGGNAPVPLASVTKIMSSLVLLADHPLAVGAAGPSITITPADVAAYEAEKAANDSVVAVRAGEQLTEREALEAALIPSADNVIRLLARWDAGTTSAFVARMNARAHLLGLDHTHYAGPSGVNPASVSSASDEARLAEVALRNPVLAQIVSMPQVELPVAGLQYNVDADLGRDGIVGVKTGWVPAGGASFVFAARHRVAGRIRTVIGAIVGVQQAPPLPSVLAAGDRLVRAVEDRLEVIKVLRPGQVVGSLTPGGGSTVRLVLTSGARLLAWPGAHVQVSVHLVRRLSLPLAAGTRVGVATVRTGTTEQRDLPVVVASRVPAPSLGWRLGRL